MIRHVTCSSIDAPDLSTSQTASRSGCHTAAPGELCEGDGAACGTRDDINNCYDASYTYPSSRDVPWHCGSLSMARPHKMSSDEDSS